VHWRIVEDDDELPQITRANQNIAATVALLRELPESVTPEERRVTPQVFITH
jgi:hypothetical protein